MKKKKRQGIKSYSYNRIAKDYIKLLSGPTKGIVFLIILVLLLILSLWVISWVF